MTLIHYRNQWDDVPPRVRAERGELLLVLVEVAAYDPYHRDSRAVMPDPRYPHWRLNRQAGRNPRQVSYAPNVEYIREKWPHAVSIKPYAAPDTRLLEGLGDFPHPEWFNKRAVRIQDTVYWRPFDLLSQAPYPHELEYWRVRLPGSKTLVTVWIQQMTDAACQVSLYQSEVTVWYANGDVLFVEQVFPGDAA